MKLEIFNKNLIKLKKQRNISLVFGLGMLLSNILLLLIIINKNDKTYIVPPNLSQQIWVTNSQVSKEYIEEMSLFYSNLLLDVSSSSAPYQRDIILRNVAPEFYGVLKSRLIQEENKYVKQNLSTSFKVKSMIIDNKKLKAIIKGNFISYVAGKQVTQTQDEYVMGFKYKFGKLELNEFKLLKERSNG